MQSGKQPEAGPGTRPKAPKPRTGNSNSHCTNTLNAPESKRLPRLPDSKRSKPRQDHKSSDKKTSDSLHSGQDRKSYSGLPPRRTPGPSATLTTVSAPRHKAPKNASPPSQARPSVSTSGSFKRRAPPR